MRMLSLSTSLFEKASFSRCVMASLLLLMVLFPTSQGLHLLRTTTGLLRGIEIVSSSGAPVHAYYGIPFAQPPLGPLRFKPPIPIQKWNGTLEASVKPNSCPQPPHPGAFPGFEGDKVWYANTPISEDCLYLNIWVPGSILEKEKVPTLLWLHGGALFFGTSTSDIFQGENLAGETGLIIASTQYRLGPLGFLYLGHEEAPGNVGLLDQVLAMTWLRDNLGVFGGDPDKLTLFGESAGGASIEFHLLSHISRTLFNSGIIMSGTYESRFQLPADAMNSSLELARVVGCWDGGYSLVREIAACLRSVSAQELALNQMKGYYKSLRSPFVATVDGKFLKDSPRNLLKAGDVKRASLLIGNVKDEGTFFMPGTFEKMRFIDKPSLISYDELVEYLNKLFSDRTYLELEAIHQEYVNWADPDDGYKNQQQVSSAAGDAYLICPSRHFADGWSGLGLQTYYYFYTHRPSWTPWAEWYGVRHTDEISFVFGNMGNHTEEEEYLSKRLMRVFANFAWEGTPNESGNCSWPQYTSADPVYMRIDTKYWTTGRGPRPRQCAFWNNYLPKLVEEFSGQCERVCYDDIMNGSQLPPHP